MPRVSADAGKGGPLGLPPGSRGRGVCWQPSVAKRRMGGGLERLGEEEGLWYHSGKERPDGSWRSVVRACLAPLAFLGHRAIPRGPRYSVWGYLAVTSCPCGSWLACPAMRVFERRIDLIQSLNSIYSEVSLSGLDCSPEPSGI